MNHNSKKIIVEKYNPKWPKQFETIKLYIWPLLKNHILSIEHVGSTSVPGLFAKAIIDIDVVIESPEQLLHVIDKLKTLGYEHRGNLGIEGRDAFTAPEKIENEIIPHHLYVCVKDAIAFKNHILLRDYLLENPEKRDEYSELKQKLALQFPNSIDSYISGKTFFILEILKKQGIQDEHLNKIKSINHPQIVQTKYNIIQAPMAGNILTPEFVATVCNHGMLGCIPAGYLDISTLQIFIQKTKELTSNPFCVNFFIDSEHTSSKEVQKQKKVIEIEKHLGMPLHSTTIVPPTIREKDYIDLILKEAVPIVSCVFGFFNPDSVQKLKIHGVKIIGTATSKKEFQYCIQHGANAVVLQGTEAGGHQGSFLSPEKNMKTTLELLNEVCTPSPTVIKIAAGGISPQNMETYFKAGAHYVQLGTVFMMTEESNLLKEGKDYIANHKMTRLTKNITGKWARGIVNELMNKLEDNEEHDVFPIQHYITQDIRNYAKKTKNPQYLSLWAGKNEDNFKLQPLKELIQKLKEAYPFSSNAFFSTSIN